MFGWKLSSKTKIMKHVLELTVRVFTETSLSLCLFSSQFPRRTGRHFLTGVTHHPALWTVCSVTGPILRERRKTRGKKSPVLSQDLVLPSPSWENPKERSGPEPRWKQSNSDKSSWARERQKPRELTWYWLSSAGAQKVSYREVRERAQREPEVRSTCRTVYTVTGSSFCHGPLS